MTLNIAPGATSGGLSLSTRAGADKEAHVAGASQVIFADFVDVLGGNNVNADAFLKAFSGSQAITVTTLGGQNLEVRGGLTGPGAGEVKATTTQTITNTLGGILIGNAAQDGPALVQGNQTITALDLSVLAGDTSGGDASLISLGATVLDIGNDASFLGGLDADTVWTIATDLSADIDGNATFTAGSGNNTDVDVTAASISLLDVGGNMLVSGGTNTSADIDFTSSGLFNLIVGGDFDVTGTASDFADARVTATTAFAITVGGDFNITGGDGDETDANVLSSTSTLTANITGALNMLANAGLNADVELESVGDLIVNAGLGITATGGSGNGAFVDLNSSAGNTTIGTSAGGMALTAGTGQDAAVFIDGNTTTLNIVGDLSAAGGTLQDSEVEIEAKSAVSVDVTGNVTLTGGSGPKSGVFIGNDSNGVTVVVGDDNPIGGSVTLTGGGNADGVAAIGTNCAPGGPCNPVVTVNALGTVSLTSATGEAFIGSQSWNNGDTAGSVSITSATGNIMLGTGKVKVEYTIGTVLLTATAGGITQATGSVFSDQLTATASTGISMASNNNDVGLFLGTVTGTGGANLNYQNDATISAVNGLGLVLSGLSTTDGNITILSTGVTNITGAVAAGGVLSTIDITAASPLNVNNTVLADGTITLTALAGGANDDVTIAANVTSTGGNVALTADDDVVLTAIVSATAGTVTTTSTNGSVSGSGSFSTGTLSVGNATSSVDVTNNAGNIDLTAMALAGTLTLNASGALTQSGALSVAGASSLFGSSVTLADPGNDFGGPVIVNTTGDATLRDANAFDLAATNVGGNLDVQAFGDITDSGTVLVAGTTSFNSGGANDVVLDGAANDFNVFDIADANNATVVDSNGINLAGLNLANNFDLTTNGNISNTGALLVGGNTAITAGAASNAILNDGGNDFVGTVKVVSANILDIFSSSGLNFDTSTISGTLTAGTTGTVSQINPIAVAGAASINAGNVTLANASNDFGAAVSLSATNVALVDANALDFGASLIGGTLSVTTNGSITDSGTLTVTGAAVFDAGVSNNIVLDNALNDFNATVTVSNANNAAFTDKTNIALGASLVQNNFTVQSGDALNAGGITQVGALTIPGTGQFSIASTLGGTVTVTNAGNAIASVAGSNAGVGDFSFNNTGVLAIGGITIADGNVSISNIGDVTLNGALTAGGSVNSVTITAASSILGSATVSADTVNLDASGSGSIGSSIATVNTDANLTSVSGAVVDTNVSNARAGGSMLLNSMGLSGSLTANTNAGAISQAGALSVAGTTNINAGANGITLNNGANDFVGSVSLNSIGANTISLTDANILNLFNTATGTGGSLNVTATLGTVNNTGTMNLSAGDLSVSALAFNNSGNINGLRDIIFSGASFTNSGSLTKTASAATSAISTIGGTSNSGNLAVNSGTLLIANGYTQSAGTTSLGGGNIQVSGGNFNLNGGSLNGTGTIDVNGGTGALNNNAGSISPGTSPGLLTILGDYAQGSSGTLNIEIGGLTQVTGYDLLSITGNASLDGVLNLLLFGGFTGNAGDSFDFIEAGTTAGIMTGNFATVNTPRGVDFTTTPNVALSPGPGFAFSATIGFVAPTPAAILPPTVDDDQVVVLQNEQEDLFEIFADDPGTGTSVAGTEGENNEEDEEEAIGRLICS